MNGKMNEIEDIKYLPKGRYIISDITKDRVIIRYIARYDNFCLYSLPIDQLNLLLSNIGYNKWNP